MYIIYKYKKNIIKYYYLKFTVDKKEVELKINVLTNSKARL